MPNGAVITRDLYQEIFGNRDKQEPRIMKRPSSLRDHEPPSDGRWYMQAGKSQLIIGVGDEAVGPNYWIMCCSSPSDHDCIPRLIKELEGKGFVGHPLT